MKNEIDEIFEKKRLKDLAHINRLKKNGKNVVKWGNIKIIVNQLKSEIQQKIKNYTNKVNGLTSKIIGLEKSNLELRNKLNIAREENQQKIKKLEKENKINRKLKLVYYAEKETLKDEIKQLKKQLRDKDKIIKELKYRER